MELDESYNISFTHLEEIISQVYNDGIKRLRNQEIPGEELKVVLGMFDALGQSRPLRGNGLEWASEIIPAYRNLAKILKKIPSQGYDITSLFSEYEDLFDTYKNGLSTEEDSRPMQLERAIEELDEIKKILKEHDASGLDDVFEKLGDLEERVEQYRKASQEFEDNM